MASAAITFGRGAAEPFAREHRAQGVVGGELLLDRRPGCPSAPSPSSSGGGANGILMLGRGTAGARDAAGGSGGGANGMRIAGGAGALLATAAGAGARSGGPSP